MNSKPRSDLTHDLFLPTLLFTALGGMTWAVRGSPGFGAAPGCIFAGVMWGAVWWYLAHDPKGEPSHRYSSAWIVLAMTLAFGFSGTRGWMQWPSFFEGRMDTNVGKGESIPISRGYGFLWLFIAGVPWAGLGACALAWCGSLKETRVWHWMLRIALGMGGAYLARYLYDKYPAYFLPLYEEFETRYKDLRANPNLRRLIGDCGSAIFHLGYYLGFLLFEIVRRDWKNVVLIVTVGVMNGAGWAAFQNWKWAKDVWPSANFNFWRCWESSGGLSIGLAYGIAYFLVNRRMSEKESALVATQRAVSGPNFEWFLIFCGLAAYLSNLLSAMTARWSPYYLTVLYVFAAAYYLVYRKSVKNGRRGYGVVGWMAVLLTLAFSGGTYPSWLSRVFGDYLPRLIGTVGNYLPSLGETLGKYQLPAGRDRVRYGEYYNLFVFALGLAWYLLFKSKFNAEKLASSPPEGDPNLERLGLYLGLLTGLGLSIRNGAKGWFHIYRGNEAYWNAQLWMYAGPTFLICLLLIAGWILFRPRRQESIGMRFPHAYGAFWLVLIVQNVIAQLVTGPWSQWNEVAFSIYYLLLFFITAVIAVHYRTLKSVSDLQEAS